LFNRGLASLDSSSIHASEGALKPPLSRSLDTARLIPISQIDPNPFQPWHGLSEDDETELSASIHLNGIIEPLVVCPQADRYCLIAGYRRLTASRKAGLLEVPCIVRDGSDSDLLKLAILENIQRRGLTPIEEAESYKRLMEVAGIDQKTVAQRLNKPTSTVNDRLALLSLPKDIRELLAKGKISIRAALEVGRIGNAKQRARLAVKAAHLDHEELKALVQRALEVKRRKKYEKRAAHPDFKDYFEGLPVKRLYKDQVTFVYKDEDEFFTTLRKVLERYDFENSGAQLTHVR